MSDLATTTNNGELMPWEEPGADIGLEMSATDVTLPRLKIVGRDGEFENSLTGERFDMLDCIILGTIKARTMWDSEVNEGDKPMCKSLDAVWGMPNLREETPAAKRFPFNLSVLTEKDLSEHDGIHFLPCEKCNFAKWDDVRNKPGLCAEQFVLPILYKDLNGDYSPGVLTLQRSGVKNTKRYLGQFLSSRTPSFTVFTTITLEKMQRGQVVYSVPKFSRGEATDKARWREYWDLFNDARTLLRTVRKQEDAAPKDESVAASKPEPAKTGSPVATAPADNVPDEDLVF